MWFHAAAREAGNHPWLGIGSCHDSVWSYLSCRSICNATGIVEIEGGCLHAGIFLAEAGGFYESGRFLASLPLQLVTEPRRSLRILLNIVS